MILQFGSRGGVCWGTLSVFVKKGRRGFTSTATEPMKKFFYYLTSMYCGKRGTTTILFIHFQTLAHAITIGVYDIRKICRLA